MAAADRGLIQLDHTPGEPRRRRASSRDRRRLGRALLRAIEWSDEARESVDEATESLADAFEGEAAITAIGKALQNAGRRSMTRRSTPSRA